MTRTKRGGFTPARIVRLLVLIAVAAFVGWLAVMTFVPRAVPAAAAWGAIDPELTFRAAGRRLVEQQGVLSDEDYRRIEAAALREPIADEPFLFFGLRAVTAGNLDGAERLLAEARDRNPRNRLARLALLSLYLRTDRVPQAGAELAAFTRLEGRATRFLVPELLPLVRDPATRGAVIAAIGDQPVMADLLDRLVEDGADPDTILALSERQPVRADGVFAAWQSKLLARLVEAGEVRRARTLWSRFVGADPSGLVYDPEFRGLKGPPPFNWTFATNDVGAAEPARGGGLDIDYFGRRAGPLAEQLLLLAPGRYRLEFRAEGAADAQGSRIVARIACRAGGNALGQIALQGLTYTPRGAAIDFAVPAGCEAQRLGFYGEAGEFPNPQQAKITGLTLRPAGGGA